MTLGAYLGLVLEGAAAVAAIVGARVYSEVLPQRPTLPALVFDKVGAFGDMTLEGSVEPRRTSVIVECHATTRAQATELGAAVLAVLQNHRGAADGFVVEAVFAAGESWDFDPETKAFILQLDFEVWC